MKTCIILLFITAHCYAETIYITGELESKNTQRVLMPSFNGKISEMEKEGKQVKKGDLLVRIDGANINTQLEAQIDNLESYIATVKKGEIDFKIQLNSAQSSFDSAKSNFEIAKMHAKIPEDFIGELKYKQNQLSLKNREKAYKKSISDLKEQNIIINNSKKKALLGIAQKQKKLDYLKSTLEDLTIYASQDGYIIYATHSWTGEKIQEGDQVHMGMNIMNVSQNNDLQVNVSVNAIDIPKLFVNQTTEIKFDAFLDKSYKGKVTKISSGGSDKKIWGDGLYYDATIKFDSIPPKNLLLGMSAQVKINIEN